MRIFEVYELWRYESRFGEFFFRKAGGRDNLLHRGQTNESSARKRLDRNASIESDMFNFGRDDVSEHSHHQRGKHGRCSLFLQSMIRSIKYEYVLNLAAILLLMELPFRLTFYDTTAAQITTWMTFQICVNAVFLLTLVLDWWALGFFSSYSKHPRVFAETVAQILNLLFFYYVVIHEWFASSVE